MPVYRTPDGKIVEEKTRIHRGADPSSPTPSDAPPASRYDDETVLNRPGSVGAAAPDASAPKAQPPAVGDSRPAAPAPNATRLAGTGIRSESGAAAQPQAVTDPVVGWLVVVAGPGRGASLTLGVGRNSIGRGEGERVSLNFGDDGISREGHAVIIYDHRGRQFFIESGQGQNLAYLNDTVLLDRQTLDTGASLLLSETELRFVAFCGEAFDWSQDSSESS